MKDKDPSYSLVPLLKRSRINKGDNINIELYIVGDGSVEKGQIFIYHSDAILSSGASGKIQSNMAPISGEELDSPDDILCGEEAKDSDYTTESTFIQRYTHCPIPGEIITSSKRGSGLSNDSNLQFEIGYTEAPEEMNPPFEYTLETTSSVDAGEYKIHAGLLYETPKGDVRQDTHELTVNVRNKLEKYSGIVFVIKVIALGLGVLSVVLTAYSTIFM